MRIWLPPLRVLVPGCLLVAFSGASASAQLPANSFPLEQSLKIGGRLGLTVLDRAEEEGGTELGPSLGLAIGYGFTERIGLFLRGDGASMEYENLPGGERYALWTIDVGARYSAGARAARRRPFAELALGGVIITDELAGARQTFTGVGATLGVGVQHFFAPRLAAELGAAATVGRITSGEIDGVAVDPDERFTSFRATVGVSWRPLVRPLPAPPPVDPPGPPVLLPPPPPPPAEP